MNTKVYWLVLVSIFAVGYVMENSQQLEPEFVTVVE